MSFLDEYYNNYAEEERLLSQHGMVEYITTLKYIHECLEKGGGKRILEIGAGTGRYSIALAREGFDVTAVEPVEHNLEQLRAKLNSSDKVRALQGDALDLSALVDDLFDITLVLGPMYHLFSDDEKILALSEAVRVTKPGGYILVAYCMNDATVIQYVFGKNRIDECRNKLTEDWRCISDPEDVFEMIRTEEIARLNSRVPAERVKLIAADGATNYIRPLIDGMDRESFDRWVAYHLATCERQDLIGATNHALDILQKNRKEAL